MKHAFLASLFLAGCCTALPAASPDPTKFVVVGDVSLGDSKIAPLFVPDSGEIEFALIQNDAAQLDASATLSLALTPFTSEQGDPIKIEWVAPANPAEIEAAGKLIAVKFRVPAQLAAGKYQGALVLTVADKPPRIWKLQLERKPAEKTAVLVADRQTVTLDFTRPFFLLFRRDRDPSFTIDLREKSGLALRNVSVQQEQAPKSPGGHFDFGRNVEFTYEPREQGKARVHVRFRDLKAGEHIVYLRFISPDSSLDDAQKVTVTVRVRHSIFYALLALLTALGLSFGGTKWVGFLRTRAALLKRIDALKRDWGIGPAAPLPPMLPVVWTRSVLEQSVDRSSRYWLTGLDAIDARVTKVEGVIGLLDEAAKLVASVWQQLPPLAAIRAKVAIDRILNNIDPRSLDDATAAQRKAELASLCEWLDPQKRDRLYWTSLAGAYQSLIDTVQASPDPAKNDPAIQALLGRPPPAIPPTNLPAMMAHEEDYIRLKVLWERRGSDDFAVLAAFAANQGLNAFLGEADRLGWGRLEQACKTTARIDVTPIGGSGQFEAFRPLLFRLKTGDAALDQLHVVLHGSVYHWKFVRRQGRREHTFEIDSGGPVIVEYAENIGDLQVTVEITRGKERTAAVSSEPVKILKSTEFLWSDVMEQVEMISLGLAVPFALVAGLSTYYWQNLTFGSMRDYLSLFLLAAGVDQTKNALQLLQATKTPTPSSPVAPAPVVPPPVTRPPG